jgi:hypothetical protein
MLVVIVYTCLIYIIVEISTVSSVYYPPTPPSRENQEAWRSHVIRLCFAEGIVPAPPRPAQPALGTIVRTTFVNPRVADTRCPPPDMSSLNGSPPPSSRRDTTQFNYDMYEWLERRQHRDVRRQQYWARAQATGSAPVVFHDWDVINDQPVQVALSPQNLHTNQPRQQGARPMAVTGHWGPRQYTAAQVGRGHRRRRPNHRKSRSGGHQSISTERPSDQNAQRHTRCHHGSCGRAQ